MARALPRAFLQDRTGRIALVLGAYTLLFILWVAFGASRLPSRDAIGDLAFLPMDLIAALLAWQVGSHTALHARARLAWRIVALALLVYAAGDALWSYYEVWQGRSPFPSGADYAYLLFYPTMMVGLLTFPFAPQAKAARLKFWLDVITVVLSGWMVLWYFVLGPTALSEQTDRLTTALSVGYPIGDLVLIFGAATVLMRDPEGESRRALGILTAGITAFLIADISFGYLQLQGRYQSGDWPDAFWMVAWFLFACSAQYQTWWASRTPRPETWALQKVRGISSLPYVAVVLGYTLLFFAGQYATPYPLGGLLYAAIAITAFVLLRQLTVMTENLQLLTDMRALATTDSLTGLLNRRQFFELAEREFARYQRYKHPLAAVMLDIDTFKEINDQYGHLAGDQVLQLVADQLKRTLRKVDVAGRYGGDELAILLPDTDLHDAARVAQRLLEAVADHPLPFGPHLLKVSLSAGVTAADGTPNLTALLHRADLALYDAKQQGRNRIKISA